MTYSIQDDIDTNGLGFRSYDDHSVRTHVPALCSRIQRLIPNNTPPKTVQWVVLGYLECAEWSSTHTLDDASVVELDTYNAEYSDQAVLRAVEDCSRFVESAGPELLRGLAPDSVGHDFWLTRNRHGVGFWDRGLGTRGNTLAAVAHRFYESYMYLGEDNLLYLED